MGHQLPRLCLQLCSGHYIAYATCRTFVVFVRSACSACARYVQGAFEHLLPLLLSNTLTRQDEDADESEWNVANKFTGWTDVDLTSKGTTEANAAGQLLKAEVRDACARAAQTRTGW